MGQQCSGIKIKNKYHHIGFCCTSDMQTCIYVQLSHKTSFVNLHEICSLFSKPLHDYSVCHLFFVFPLTSVYKTMWAFLCLQITMHMCKVYISHQSSGAAPRGRSGCEVAQSDQGGDTVSLLVRNRDANSAGPV